MLSFRDTIYVTRGEGRPIAGKWLAKGKKYRSGVYTLAILRGEHPDEPELAVFDHLTIEDTKAGTVITLSLTAEQIAAAQGPARPEVEQLVYRLRHDGAEALVGPFSIHPRSNQVDAPRKVAARKGVPA